MSKPPRLSTRAQKSSTWQTSSCGRAVAIGGTMNEKLPAPCTLQGHPACVECRECSRPSSRWRRARRLVAAGLPARGCPAIFLNRYCPRAAVLPRAGRGTGKWRTPHPFTPRDVISCIPETVSQPREIPHVGTWGRVATRTWPARIPLKGYGSVSRARSKRGGQCESEPDG